MKSCHNCEYRKEAHDSPYCEGCDGHGGWKPIPLEALTFEHNGAKVTIGECCGIIVMNSKNNFSKSEIHFTLRDFKELRTLMDEAILMMESQKEANNAES